MSHYAKLGCLSPEMMTRKGRASGVWPKYEMHSGRSIPLILRESELRQIMSKAKQLPMKLKEFQDKERQQTSQMSQRQNTELKKDTKQRLRKPGSLKRKEQKCRGQMSRTQEQAEGKAGAAFLLSQASCWVFYAWVQVICILARNPGTWGNLSLWSL